MQRLLDFDGDGGNNAVRAIEGRPHHGVDFLAVLGQPKAQVYKPASAWEECAGSSAIRVDYDRCPSRESSR